MQEKNKNFYYGKHIYCEKLVYKSQVHNISQDNATLSI